MRWKAHVLGMLLCSSIVAVCAFMAQPDVSAVYITESVRATAEYQISPLRYETCWRLQSGEYFHATDSIFYPPWGMHVYIDRACKRTVTARELVDNCRLAYIGSLNGVIDHDHNCCHLTAISGRPYDTHNK